MDGISGKAQTHARKSNCKSNKQTDSILHKFSHTIDILFFFDLMAIYVYKESEVESSLISLLPRMKSTDLKLLPLKILFLIWGMYVLSDIVMNFQTGKILSGVFTSCILYDLIRMAFNCSIKVYSLQLIGSIRTEPESTQHNLKLINNFGQVNSNGSFQWYMIGEGTLWRFILSPFSYVITKFLQQVQDSASQSHRMF